MNFLNKAKTLTILACSAGVAFAAPTVEIGKWGNFCQGAVSHTFDDGTAGQSSVAVPAFNAKGLHMTMFVVINWVGGKWTPFQNAFKDGHEIGSHSNSHTKQAPASDLSSSQKSIQQNVPGEKCVTYAYPECTPGTGSSQYYIASRSCTNATINSATSPNWENINSQFVDENVTYGGIKGSGMNAFADAAASQGGWAVYAHHGVGNGDHSMYTDANALKSHVDYLSQNRGKIWCETFGNVARYIKERSAATAAVTSSDDNTVKLTLKDNLDNATYNFPLSLRFEMPSGWTDPTVTQDGKAIKDTVVTVNSKKYVMFQAVPDGGDIVVSGNGTSIKEQVKLFETGKMVLIDNNSLSINSHQFSGSNINVSLFNLNGKVIANYTLNNSESSVTLPSKKLRNEAYFVKVSDGRKTYTEKVTPQL
jgi:oligosaccharide reducing-end xylanase